MTRDAGQVTPREAAAGALLVAVVIAGIVAGLRLLLDAGQPEPPLPAPAEPIAEIACPEQVAARGAVSVTAGELIECPRSYDGSRVRYEGEVVGAVLHRGERAWVQLNDDPYALVLGPLPEHRTTTGGNSGIAVSVPARTAEEITRVGSHRFHGDVIEVTGVFHRADPHDQGGPAIQADGARISRPGRPVSRPLEPARAVTAAALASAAGGAAILAQRRRRPP